MAIQLVAWYQNVPLAAVRACVDASMRALGFAFAPSTETDDEEDVCGWEIVRLDDAPLWYALTTRTEDHVVFELMCRGDAPSLLQPLLSLFDELVHLRAPSANEAMLALTSTEIYPFFSHSLHRAEALHLVELHESGEILAERAPLDEGYWEAMGERLHFVASHLFSLPEVPSPEDWAQSITAKLLETPHGPIFDCAWSKRSPGSKHHA